MEKDSERVSVHSGNSAYLSVGLDSDNIEMQDMGRTSRSENDTDTLRDYMEDGDQKVPDDEHTDVEDEPSAAPLLTTPQQPPKQVKFSKAVRLNNESIEMRRTSSQGQSSAEAENLLAETNVDEIAVERSSENPDEAAAPAEPAEGAETKRKKRLISYLSTQNPYVRLMKPTKMKFVCLSVSFVILFLAIFLPNCIFSIHYDKIALARNKFTGVVNTRHAYGPGLHFMLPWTEWILYDKTAMSDDINDLSIFTTDKLLVNASFKIFYFFDKDKLGEMYTKFGPNYEEIIMAVSRSELMNAGQQFSIDDYRTKRVKVRKYLRDKLASRLKDNYTVNLFDLYLDKLQFTDEINQLNLKRMLNGIFNEKAVYEKQTVVTREETNLLAQRLRNQAALIVQSAELEANYTYLKMAQVSQDTLLEKVFVGHLNKSYNELSFYDGGAAKAASNKKLMMSYCWLSSLVNCKGNITYYIMDRNLSPMSAAAGAPLGTSPAFPGFGYEGMLGVIV